MKFKNTCVRVVTAAILLVSGAQLTAAAPGVTFQDIAAGGGAGISYGRTPSARLSILQAIQADGLLNGPVEYPFLPYKTYGAPGVAALDYDNDGDLDLYVTNGPGTPNSLFSNLLKETGTLTFQDVGESSGAGLSAQDSNGVCFGDLENDGDLDLYVVGFRGNHLLQNNGDGSFQDVTAASGTGGQVTTSTSCSMGDVNADGLLDILVGNTFDDFSNQAFRGGYAKFQHNQLLVNQGNMTFADRSDSSGIKTLVGVPSGAALPSWAVSLIDIDLDGDLDAVAATDQHGIFPETPGYVRIFKNNGTGQFTDSTVGAQLNRQGEWRGLAFGDLDCNGKLDIFSSNIGDYIFNPGFFAPGTWASRWFLGQSNGTFTDPGVGALVTLPTGWGAAISDYDNDGDSDILYHGGWEFSVLWDESNPGILLNNQGCSASFTWDLAALAGSTDHSRRNVEGLATGDFNNDGFVDIVTVASFDVAPTTPYEPIFSAPIGSPFDVVAVMALIATPPQVPFGDWAWRQGYSRTPGTVSLEINSGNSNRWAAFDLVGTRGLVDNQVSSGRVNRDGIGAIVRFTPEGGPTTLNPVVGGSSYASQNSLRVQVGLGTATRGTVEVLWPGGVKNRLYDVAASERLVLPEIPCSFDSSMTLKDYKKCVKESLKDLRHPHVGVLTHQQADRLEQSALRAYDEAH